MKDEKHFGLRINSDLLRKFHYVCDYEGRSANSQIIVLIREAVEAYEQKHGKIQLSKEK
jgi:Arc-like DNA binding domain.